MSHGQTKVTVKGMVLDAVTNRPMVGVSVRSAKTDKVLSASGSTGAYSVSTTSNDDLIFTFTGYTASRISLTGRNSFVINVKMSTAQNMLEETVVQGFSRRSRQTLTGSSVSISGKDLQDNPVANITELLQSCYAVSLTWEPSVAVWILT